MLLRGETELCCYIKNYFSTSYVFYTYDELKKVFFFNSWYKNTINDIVYDRNNKFGNMLVLSLANLLNTAEYIPDKKIINVTHHNDLKRKIYFYVTNDYYNEIYLLCRKLKIPIIHICYFLTGSDKVVQFWKDRICNEYFISKCVYFYETTIFNLIKSRFQLDYGLYRHYSDIFDIYFRIVTKNNTRGFICKTNTVLYNYQMFNNLINSILYVFFQLDLLQSNCIWTERVYCDIGKIIAQDNAVLGNLLATMNYYLLKCNFDHCIAFDYNIVCGKDEKLPSKDVYSHELNVIKPNFVMDILVTGTDSTDSDYNALIDRHCLSHTHDWFCQNSYDHMIRTKLSLDSFYDSKQYQSQIVNSGAVINVGLFINKAPSEASKIHNQPLVKFVFKHKTCTSSFYKDAGKIESLGLSTRIKYNFNIQGSELLLRAKFLAFNNKHKTICNFGSNEPIVMSNLCSSFGLAGVINSFSARSRLLKEEYRCFKTKSFPAVKMVGHIQGINLVHREKVLTRSKSNLNAVNNLGFVLKTLKPYSETLHDLKLLVFGIESHYDIILNNKLLALSKVMFLYGFSREFTVDFFIKRLWINQYIIPQNQNTSLNAMCHNIFCNSACDITSIKSIKYSQVSPPIIKHLELLSEIDSKFEDSAVRPIVNRLWRGRGAWNYFDVFIQSPTRVIYSSIGERYLMSLKKLLDKNGGESVFPSSYELLHIFMKHMNLCNDT